MDVEMDDDNDVGNGDENELNLNALIDSAVQSYFGGGTKQHRKRGLKKRIKATQHEPEEEEATNSESVSCVSLDGVRELLENTEKTINSKFSVRSAVSEDRLVKFGEWCEYLDADFNLLFYGCGSQLRLLQQFCSLLGGSRVQLMGYENDTSVVRRLLLGLNDRWRLRVEATKLSLVQLATAVVSALSERDQHTDGAGRLLLVVHGWDGVALRQTQSQAALFVLAQCPLVTVLASVDHINAALLFTQQDLIRGKFIMIESSTFTPYVTEVLAGSSKLLGLSGKGGRHSHSLASLESFWASLTENAKQMFVVMARAALNEQNTEQTNAATGISFWQLYRDCKSEFIVSSELQLQQQLVEFCDHNLVQTHKSEALGDRLHVTVDLTLLHTFLQSHALY